MQPFHCLVFVPFLQVSRYQRCALIRDRINLQFPVNYGLKKKNKEKKMELVEVTVTGLYFQKPSEIDW